MIFVSIISLDLVKQYILDPVTQIKSKGEKQQQGEKSFKISVCFMEVRADTAKDLKVL